MLASADRMMAKVNSLYATYYNSPSVTNALRFTPYEVR